MIGKLCPYIERECTDKCASYSNADLMIGLDEIRPDPGLKECGSTFNCFRIYNEVAQSVRNAKEINKMNKIK
jgi:hypothetical protein